VSTIGAIGLFLFYFPPAFEEVHKRDHRTKWQEFKDFDFVGVLLFIGGTTVLLLGISWGGVSYPWKSAGVIVPIIIGFLTLIIFGFWETYAKLAEPVIPTRLFRNFRGFTVVLIAEFVSGMLLYALIALYPVQIATVYTSDPSKAAWEDGASLLGTFVCVIVLGNTLGKIGHARWLFVGGAVGCTIFIGSLAAMSEYLTLNLHNSY
jgi:hypothetical protein